MHNYEYIFYISVWNIYNNFTSLYKIIKNKNLTFKRITHNKIKKYELFYISIINTKQKQIQKFKFIKIKFNG